MRFAGADSSIQTLFSNASKGPRQDEIFGTGAQAESMEKQAAMGATAQSRMAGIQGAGLKTISKRLSFLCEDKMHTLDDVYGYCSETQSKVKFYSNVVENWETVETNYKVMNLTPPSISVQGRQKINFALDNFEFELNATELKRCSLDHGFGSYDWSELMAMLRGLVEKNKQVAWQNSLDRLY